VIDESDLIFQEDSDPETGEFQCPGCDRSDFKSERGMRKHCTQAHPEIDLGESTKKSSSPRKSRLLPKLEDFFLGVGMLLSFKCQECGTWVGTQAKTNAEAWDKLAKESPTVRKGLERFLTTSAWGGVAITTGMTLLPILEHHNIRLMPKPKLRPVPNPDNPGEYLASLHPTTPNN
jgi:hypothetical protein